MNTSLREVMICAKYDWVFIRDFSDVAGKCVSHHHHHLVWERTERRRVYRDTGLADIDWAMTGEQ